MSKNNGGPAFPQDENAIDGMSLRDWFAGQALAAMLSTETCQSQLEKAIRDQMKDRPEGDRREIAREILATRAYQQADAMIRIKDGTS